MVVTVDALEQVFEYNASGHATAEGNNVSAPLEAEATLGPYPDLQVASISAPSLASSGVPMAVAWTVKNFGNATASESWMDRLYLSADPRWDSGDTELGSQAYVGPLAAGEEYAANMNVTAPVGTEGNYFIVVRADATNVVGEAVFEGNNDGASGAVELTIPPQPDLTVRWTRLSTTALSGGVVEAHWEVVNDGPSRAEGSWVDRVYLSMDATWDGADTLLASFPHEGGLDAGGSYGAARSLTIPERADGDYHLIVWTDAGTVVYEHDREANNRIASPSAVAVVHPDLRVTGLTAPAETSSGDGIQVEWTVTNMGTGQTNGSTWRDAVYLSVNDVWDSADRLLAEWVRTEGLSVQGIYTAQRTVTVPDGVSGSLYLIVRTDISNAGRTGWAGGGSSRSGSRAGWRSPS